MGIHTNGAASAWTVATRSLFGLALLASCMTASAQEIQRLGQSVFTEILFHEKGPQREMGEGFSLAADDLRLVAEVGRIIVNSGDAEQFADTITAQFAVQPPDQPPADTLTITMAHDADGIYKVADESRSAMGDWFAGNMGARMGGNVVLLGVDGLADAQSDADVQFDIEGECAMCGNMQFISR